jgi:predicted RNA-binding protein with RPS1 domain
MPSSRHVVVDGSNLATEGRTLPNLNQLEEAVIAFEEEHPGSEVIVVVDATFEHRIDDKDRERFRAAELRGEYVSPPAGTIGRGDAFILRIAKRTNAIVLSNDSFQEFHGEHPWLFDEGRLIGGKPVPVVGWIFTPRNPVRGAKSRASTKDAAKKAGPPKKLAVVRPDGTKPKVGDTLTRAAPKPIRVRELAADLGVDSKTILELAKKAKVEAKSHASALEPEAVIKVRAAFKARKLKAQAVAEQLGLELAELKDLAASLGLKVASAASAITQDDLERLAKVKDAKARRATAAKKASKVVTEVAEVEGTEQPGGRKRRRSRRRSGSKSAETEAVPVPASDAPTNAPLDLVNFLATYEVGSTVAGMVSSFTSHGAMIEVDLGGGRLFHCYIRTVNLGDPPPTKARDALRKGDTLDFVLLSLDAKRRVAELGLSQKPAKATKAKKSSKTAPAATKVTKKASATAKPAAAAKKATKKASPTKASSKKAPAKKSGASKTPTKSSTTKAGAPKKVAKKSITKAAKRGARDGSR